MYPNLFIFMFLQIVIENESTTTSSIAVGETGIKNT